MTDPAGQLVAKPSNVTLEQAAAVPISGLAAIEALRDTGRLQPGQHVLILGASGAVGTFAVQIAKALGAEVTGVGSTRNIDLIRAVGADHVIDYTREDATDGSRRALRGFERVVLVATPMSGPARSPLEAECFAPT